MNSKLFVVALSFIALPAFAAPSSKISSKNSGAKSFSTPASVSGTESTSSMSVPTSAQPHLEPKGVRLSVFKPALRMNVQTVGTGNNETSLDNTWGVSGGYANLPFKKLGWTANATYIEIFQAGEKIGLIRTDANVGYGFAKNLNAKGGLNLSKFVIPGRIRDEYNPSFGVQGSVGLQVTKYVGVEAGYTAMKQTNARQDVELSGLEIGLNGTF